jgi:hypothetical protein
LLEEGEENGDYDDDFERFAEDDEEDCIGELLGLYIVVLKGIQLRGLTWNGEDIDCHGGGLQHTDYGGKERRRCHGGTGGRCGILIMYVEAAHGSE